MNRPSVSIITPSYSHASYIEETIQSVLSQNGGNIEYIVVDGNSADGTLDILKKYETRMRWISEKDRGQADAVNKGFQLATGDIIGWINSDDTYLPNAVREAVQYLADHPEVVMVYGDAYHVDISGKRIKPYESDSFSFGRLAKNCCICQPAVFIRKEVVREVGLLDTNLQTAMDYDYWCRIGRRFGEKKIAYLQGKFIANSRYYEDSKTLRMRKVVFKESMAIQKRYFGKIPFHWRMAYIKQVVLGMRSKL